MGKQKIQQGVIILLMLVVIVGAIFLRTQFTGFVTVGETATVIFTSNFSEGGENMVFDSNYSALVLENLSMSGTYTSPVLGNGSDRIWSNFVYNVFVPENLTADLFFSVRNCEVSDCNGTEFVDLPANMNLSGKYFQYKVVMQAPENMTPENVTESPRLYEVNISYTYPVIIPPAVCGDGVPESPEECDYGAQNGVACTPAGSDCGYCSADCKIVYVEQAPCGDGTCAVDEDCNNCPADCGSCPTESTTETVSQNVPVTCTPSWICSGWGVCTDGIQTRTCTDSNNCGSEAPAQSQSCAEETPTQKKSFLSTVGSVITAPVSFVFSNKTRAFIFSGLVVLIAGGFVLFKFVLKRKIVLPQFLKNIANLEEDADDVGDNED
jgi:hypothetical protein